MGDDDDDLYDELYGDEEDTPVELPAAPVPKSGGFKIPKVVEPEPVPVPEPVPEPTADATTAKADDSDSDDFDIALNEPDVGDPDDPDDFKIVLDDTEALYGVGATAEQGEYGEDGMDGMQTDQPSDPRASMQNVPPPPPKDIRHNSKTYVRDGPPPPAPPPGAPANLANLAAPRAGPPPTGASAWEAFVQCPCRYATRKRVSRGTIRKRRPWWPPSTSSTAGRTERLVPQVHRPHCEPPPRFAHGQRRVEHVQPERAECAV